VGLACVDLLLQSQIHFPQKLHAFKVQRDVFFGIGSVFKDHSGEDLIISDNELSKWEGVLDFILSL
jgi:hypothetical protein